MMILVIVAVVVIIAALGGFMYLKAQQAAPIPTPSPAQIPTPTVEVATPTTAPSSPSAQTKADWATFTSTKLNGVSFNTYTIQYPLTWTPATTHTAIIDNYILTKGNYQIKIYQAAMGGNGCIFEGSVPEGPMQDLRKTPFTEIDTAGGMLLRRYVATSQNPAQTVFSFCASSDGTSWGSPTSVGAISYTAPSSPTDATLAEMDSILKTLVAKP